MSEYFKYKINSKVLILIKPSKWNIITYQKIASKIHLHETTIIKYIIYYSQKHYDTKEKRISFNEINTSEFHVIEKIFIEYVNSDQQILERFNNNQDVVKHEKAFQLIKEYFIDTSFNTISIITGASFVVSLYNSWFNVLKGEVTNQDFEQLDNYSDQILNSYKSKPEYFDNFEFIIKDINNYKANKVFIKKYFVRLGRIIAKAKKSDIWLPSRYSQKIIEELLPYNLSELETLDFATLVFNHSEKDINQNFLNDWTSIKFLEDRNHIFTEAFNAYKNQLYAPAIVFFLTQLDFIIMEIAKALNIDNNHRNTNLKIISDIIEYIDNDILYNKYLSDFFPKDGKHDQVIYFYQLKSLSQYLKNITYEDTSKIDNDVILNRHGILHGKFIHYSNNENSIKIILLIDEILQFYKNILKTTSQV